MSSQTKQIEGRFKELGDKKIAAQSQRFFKTGKGEYGEGDIFLGIRVPVIRKCVREFHTISVEKTLELLRSPFHEVRLLALLIFVRKYSTARSADDQELIYQRYLENTRFINNWDLVDSSAEHIVGAHLLSKKRAPIYRLIRSECLWERRIGVIATFRFIKNGDFSDTLAVAEMLLQDKEDLIHKAVGWMLREIGNRDPRTEEEFLDRHYPQMPRTMLRYAIEKLPEEKRQAYLRGNR